MRHSHLKTRVTQQYSLRGNYFLDSPYKLIKNSLIKIIACLKVLQHGFFHDYASYHDKKSAQLRILLLVSCILYLASFLTACGRRGDPVLVEPYIEVGAVKNLKVSIKDEGVNLMWGLPKDKNFPRKAIKSFLIFRAEVPHGIKFEKCECEYKLVDSLAPGKEKKFEYIDKGIIKNQAYAYKIVVMDKNKKLSKDSNIVLVGYEWIEPKKFEVYQPHAPHNINAIYTKKSVILTWDEVLDVEIYRIYRAMDTGGKGADIFILIGETVTPVFTDKDIESLKKYYYRITAMGDSESIPSGIIEVITESK
ncbi:MAG: hypothetical protein HY752_02880 [Nitrospirae bacterium]|nr:hypothetical protein [Nitrospirota bacterium]